MISRAPPEARRFVPLPCRQCLDGKCCRELPSPKALLIEQWHTGLCIFLIALTLAGDPRALAEEPPATAPARRPAATQPRVALFQPGIRINWTQRQVEVDFTVVLRDAPIELFACSPRNREYESIVRIEARPTHLYQALGLIGLTPGHPMRVDDQGQVTPATGDPVDVEVRYNSAGQTRQEPIENWMRPVEGNAPLQRQPWVFAGSIPLGSGRGIASDVEGTVVAIVDFSTSLIALPASHSSSNDELWLRPNTERIPPIGTRGELIIRTAPLRVRLESAGRLLLAGKPATRAELSGAISRRIGEDPGLRVEITVARGADSMEEKSLLALIRGLKVSDNSIAVFADSGERRPITR